MDNKISFCILGGDKRQVRLAQSICDDGYKVYAVGFDDIEFEQGIVKENLDDGVSKGKYVILPVNPVKGNKLNVVYSNREIYIDEKFCNLLEGKKVFTGLSNTLVSANKAFKNIDLLDYSKKEDFKIKNAVPTVEAALMIAIRESERTIEGSRCLVTGFGRLGKAMSRILGNLGASVSVSARKERDWANIKLCGFDPVVTERIIDDLDYDIIFNTIPSVIFEEKALKRMRKDTILIDLASLPGGVDFNKARELNLNVIQALALPGKFSPQRAGEIIKETIYSMIEEEGL